MERKVGGDVKEDNRLYVARNFFFQPAAFGKRCMQVYNASEFIYGTSIDRILRYKTAEKSNW